MAILVFAHSDLTGADQLGAVLRLHGHQLRVVRLHRGETVPAGIDDIDGILICGGPQSPLDDSIPWRRSQMELLRSARSANLPFVGICLGSQLMARTFGGEVELMEGGIELGWHPVTLTPAGRIDVLLGGIGWTTTQPHWHRYGVTRLPEGATLLASSAACPVQAWSLGANVYAFQYHPEIFPDTLVSWADDEPKDLEEVGMTRPELVEQTHRHYDDCARLADRLFTNIAIMLMPIDRRHAG